MKQGDFIGLPLGDKLFQVIKILRIDSHPKMGETFHCMTFDPVSNLPSPESIRMLKLAAYHVPMDGSSIRENGKVLFNIPVSEKDLFGYYE
jgi:hypothetical protein